MTLTFAPNYGGTGFCDFNSSHFIGEIVNYKPTKKQTFSWMDSFLCWCIGSYSLVMMYAVALVTISFLPRAVYHLQFVGRVRHQRRRGHLTVLQAALVKTCKILFRTNKTCRRIYEGLDFSRGHVRKAKIRQKGYLAILLIALSQATAMNERTLQQFDQNSWGENDITQTRQTFPAIVHSMTRTAVTIGLDSTYQNLQLREDVQGALHFKPDSNLAKNFNLYQVQPHPQVCTQSFCVHFLLERPGDRNMHHSMTLVDIDAQQLQLGGTTAPWILPTKIYRNELLWEIGIYEECNKPQAIKCLLSISGVPWLPKENEMRVLPNGGLIEIRLLLMETDQCEADHLSETSSDFECSEEDQIAFMQTMTIEQGLERRVKDPIYRMLIDTINRRHTHRETGQIVSLWGLLRGDRVQEKETRIWIDRSQPSWTTSCIHAMAETENLRLTEDSASYDFFLASPQPPEREYTVNNFYVLMVYKKIETDTVILADFHYNGLYVRRAVNYEAEDTVEAITSRYFRTDKDFVLAWDTPDGEITFESHEVPRLPNGASVDIYQKRRSCPEDERTGDGLLLIQLDMQTRPSTMVQRDGSIRGQLF